MNIIATTALGIGLVLGSAFMPASAQPARNQQIAGTWTLVSIYEENESGEDIDQWGRNPRGHFVADGSGHFMLQIVGPNAIQVASAASAPLCAGASVAGAGYAGSYSLDPNGRITFTIDEALAPKSDGNRATASIRFENERMHFVSSAEGSPTGAFYSHLVWKRAE